MPELVDASRGSFRMPSAPSVEELVKELIIHRRYRPGDKLPTEVEFAGELGVSRNAVREAMRSLQTLGIVEIRHGRGLFLAETSLARVADGLSFWGRLLSDGGTSVIQHAAEVRDRLETSLVGDVVDRLTSEDIAELEAAVDEIAQAAQRGVRAVDADRRFHEILYRPLDNWVLVGLLHALWESIEEVAASHEPDFPLVDIAEYHQRILDAIVARDGEAATAAMHEHFVPLLTNSNRRDQSSGS